VIIDVAYITKLCFVLHRLQKICNIIQMHDALKHLINVSIHETEDCILSQQNHLQVDFPF
jgi:hypothetical protein